VSRLGRVYLKDGEAGPSFLGGSDGGRDYSEQTARKVDREVRRLLDEATEEVRCLLRRGRSALEAVARRLIEKEVIDGAELRDLIMAHPLAPAPHPELAGAVTDHPPVNGHVNGHAAKTA